MNRTANAIKRAVSMPEMLAHYGLSDGSKKRIPCPIHGGKNNNFAVKDSSFRCFVCGANGTVLDFAMQYFGLDFAEAMAKINEDFSLGLDISGQGRASIKAMRTIASREAEAENERLANARTERRYYDALDRWTRLDTMRRENAPQGITDPIRDEYAYAIRHIDAAEAELQEAQNALYDLKHERG